MRLPRTFYARDAATVAADLLGKVLCVRGERVQRARVTETEAYVGPHDLACHASRGLTPRTATMHGPPGHAYVYLVYGIHDMLNVVTGPTGHGEAVLVRAAEPVEGARLDGPGRLTKALGITVARDNGTDLLEGRIWFEDGAAPPRVAVTPRIGIDYAGAWAAAPLRFVDANSPHVSRRV